MKNRYNLQEKGGVYAIKNDCIVDHESKEPLTKIGRSGKENVNDRIESMNRETTVPKNFDVERIVNTPANQQVEKLVHAYYDDERYNSRKEYFKVPAEDAAKTIEKIAEDVEKHSYVIQDTYCPMSEEEKNTMINDGYIPNDYVATPFSDAVYIPDENDCPDGIDSEKWKKSVGKIKLDSKNF